MGRQWDGLKTRFPGSCIHIKTADETSKKNGSTCMLQSGARASKAMSWRTSGNFVLERKKGTFRRNPRRTKLLFRACKTLDFPLLKWPFQGICTRKCINCYSFGHFPHRPGTVWCHHRHGLLQMLLPFCWLLNVIENGKWFEIITNLGVLKIIVYSYWKWERHHFIAGCFWTLTIRNTWGYDAKFQ